MRLSQADVDALRCLYGWGVPVGELLDLCGFDYNQRYLQEIIAGSLGRARHRPNDAPIKMTLRQLVARPHSSRCPDIEEMEEWVRSISQSGDC